MLLNVSKTKEMIDDLGGEKEAKTPLSTSIELRGSN